MHVYDPDGSLRAYREERNRRENIYSILFGIGTVCALIFLVSAVLLVRSVWGQ